MTTEVVSLAQPESIYRIAGHPLSIVWSVLVYQIVCWASRSFISRSGPCRPKFHRLQKQGLNINASNDLFGPWAATALRCEYIASLQMVLGQRIYEELGLHWLF